MMRNIISLNPAINNFGNMNNFNPANLDPMTYQSMQNFMLMMNPSINTANQMNFNNMMMNFMCANPFIFQLFMNSQNNNNFNNINNMNNFSVLENTSQAIKNKSKKGGILPRNSNISSIDPFAGNMNRRIAIVFITGTGIKVTLSAPIDVSIEQLFEGFIKKVNLDKSVLGKYIYFLFNGFKIPIHEKKTVVNYGLKDASIILVIDTSNLLGGNN